VGSSELQEQRSQKNVPFHAAMHNRAIGATTSQMEQAVRIPWRLKWTLAEFASLDYRKHSAVLQSAPAFYVTALAKFIPGVSPDVKYLPLRDGHVIPVRDFMTLYIYKEIFVDRCYDLSFDRSAPVIVDIGANSGLFALRLKQLYPLAKIVCYEPFQPNFVQLENTIAINRLDGVTPLQKAVGARPGHAKLFIHKRNMGGHSFYAAEALNNDHVDVEVVDVPSILGGLQQDVDLLKLDCEGAEFDILMNLAASDARQIRRIIVETTSGLYDVDKLNDRMASLGYHHQPKSGLCLYSQRADA
jgi:FkbM family methyltransferase